ncbi:YgfZ/GcvT domain-containing protein [Tropheryma whipplei]|uniref:CAF17-like 4Fe-4S cluster assembly/insertion protein YgfZ n=1 Tax=Tropheryma whipplei TaxID=2039 RepID=UPI0004B8D489|nr:glycine cleavage T C-terminal barrel domain-containing protein [Tropheryma whipplei]MCO8182894.1 folate-binding protein YgfZ [Tropheryma whipplei]MCO8190614.1 folate-binding protein YgfZ [Tropheryma whipplei]
MGKSKMVEKDHYGSIFHEQRDLYAGKSVVPLDPARVLRLFGEDRFKILHAISTQDYTQPMISTETLFLNSQGRVINRACVVAAQECAWLFCDSGKLAGQLAEYLLSMRFTLKFDIEPVKELFFYAGFCDPPERLAEWQDPWPNICPGGYSYAPTDLEQPPWGIKFFLCRTQLSGPFSGTHALLAGLIAAGRPSMREVDELSLPHELGWLRTAVHLTKGCYRGQELVAKLHNLGRPPRRMVRLMLDGQLPMPDAVILCDGKRVGRVTSVANHWELGPIALGVVKRSVPEGKVLLVDSEQGPISALVETLVSPDSGSVASVPRMKRLT